MSTSSNRRGLDPRTDLPTHGIPASKLPTAIQAPPRHADENVVRQAEGAFGTSIDRESIGMYSSTSVRGLSPIAARNARIDGMYFAPLWTPSMRIRRSVSIRVGLSAQGFAFPAPTGIVDFAL